MGFFEDVYKVVEIIPKGKVVTYGQIARVIGSRDARRVGHALHANKTPLTIACHRVVFADGRMAPGYAFGGPEKQKMKLLSEGVVFKRERVDLSVSGWMLGKELGFVAKNVKK